MDVILIVDMQAGMLDGAPKHDLAGVVTRINALMAMVRGSGGKVVWIRHCGRPGDGFEKGAPGWEFLPELVRAPEDIEVGKALNDAYAGTGLAAVLRDLNPSRVLVCGWATDFCVDSTVRSTVSHGFPAVVAADAHTLSDRPHLEAQEVIRHHNWLWSELIADPPVRVLATADLLAEEAGTP
ncbi:isochorismatase family protein [Oceanibaculum nanhaiense]|uniref:isochorismatase family protein n=1 Tax=Oceanibaculum nanhaiense TaxID=1909734 RepID=UPI00396D5E1D